MNAKTTKFLAVFAVLAMAFAAVAVFAPAESDAVEAQSVWTTDAGANWSLTLGSDAIIPTDGQTIDGKKVYYVNTDMSLVMSKDADLSVGGTLIMLKSGVHVNVQVPQTHEKTIAFAVAGVDESEDAKGNTVLTFYGDYSGSAFQAWVGTTDNKGFHFPTKWTGDADADNTNTIIGNQTIGLSKENGGGNFEFESGVTVDGNEKKVVYMAYTDTDCAWYLDKGFFSGTFQYVYQYSEPGAAGAIWNLKDATGVIGSYGETNKLKLNGFTGVVKMAAGKEIIIEDWISGDMEVVEGTFEFGEEVTIPAGSELTFAQGTTIPQNFSVSFVRYVVDKYTFTNGAVVKAGVGGFTIAPGENGFELSGSIDGAPAWTFIGAASFTGIINAGTETATITADANYDFTFKSATVYTGGLTLTNGAAIEDDAVVNINKVLSVTKGSLKIGDDAYVRVYGALTTPKIYSAGNVVADTMKIGENDVKADVPYSGAFVYQDGSIKVSDLKLTKLEEVRMAYVYLTGAGVLGINGIEVISNDATITGNADTAKRTGGYYEYYCMVFYPVAAQDVLNLKAQSGIVGGIETDADLLSEPDIDLDLQYAKYKINYEARTPTFVIEYKETYKVILNGVNKDFTITDSEGKPVYITSETVNNEVKTYAKLIYGETYSLNGKVAKNKYTYTSNLNADIEKVEDYVQPIEYVSTILSTFEQVRQEQTITASVGLAMDVTVEVATGTDAVAAGDKVLEYYVDGDDEPTEVTVALNTKTNKLEAKFTVFSTDNVLVKLDKKKYFTVDKVMNAALTEKGLTEEQEKAGWSFAFAGATTQVNKGTITLEYALDAINDVYILSNPDNLDVTYKVTIVFQDYYQGTGDANNHVKHAAEFTVTLTNAAIGIGVPSYVGETYTMTWEEVKDVNSKMTYPAKTAGADPEVYTKGDLVTIVKNKKTVGNDVTYEGTTYTLEVTKIRYAILENNTDIDLTVTYGDSVVEIKKGEKLETSLVVKVKDRATNPMTFESEYMILESKGRAITSWSGYYGTPNVTTGKVAEADQHTIRGAGPSSTEAFAVSEGQLVSIDSVISTKLPFLVKTDEIQHGNLGDYTRAGHYEDKMYIYPVADPGFTVFDVEVYYEDPENEGQPGKLYCTATESEDGTYRYYSMPDSNVVLKAIIEQSTYDLTFVNQDGEPVAETMKVPPFSTDPIDIPAIFGYVAIAASIDVEIEGEFVFDPKAQTVTFEMPTHNAVITVTYDAGGPFSDDMDIFVSKTTDGIKVTMLSNDERPIQSGYLTIDYWYVYEEDGIYGMEQVILDPIELALGSQLIVSCPVTLAEEEFFGAIYYVSATFEPINGDAMKSDYIAYQMA